MTDLRLTGDSTSTTSVRETVPDAVPPIGDANGPEATLRGQVTLASGRSPGGAPGMPRRRSRDPIRRAPQASRSGSVGSSTMIAAATLAAGLMVGLEAAPAAAQTTFQCSGGPDEEQVGLTMQGPVTVPLCVRRPASGRVDASRHSAEGGAQPVDPLSGIYVEGPRHGPPRGWRPTYGAFMSFVVSQDETGGNEVYDMVLTLDHATPAEAASAATALCVRRALFPEPSSACHPEIIDRPYFAVVQRDVEDGRFELVQFNDRRSWSDHTVNRPSGRVEVCAEADAPDYPRPCSRLVVFDRNGIWPK